MFLYGGLLPTDIASTTPKPLIYTGSVGSSTNIGDGLTLHIVNA